MISADYLFLMTDVECLYSTNPRKDPNAKPISVVHDISSLDADISSRGSALGTGGMSTKIVAARLATSAGVMTIITKSSKPGHVLDIVNYLEALKTQTVSQSAIQSDAASSFPPTIPAYFPEPPLHTRFLPFSSPIRDRSFWLLHGLAPHGTVYIDQGAYKALRNKAGLLPVGVVHVDGHFSQQEAVRLAVVRRSHHSTLQRMHIWNHRPSKSLSSDISEPLTPTGPSTPQEALASGGLSSYSATLDFGAAKMIEEQVLASNSTSGTTTPLQTPASSIYQAQPTAPSPFFAADPPPREVGRALVNYSSAEISRIKGFQSHEIVNVLGYAESEYVAFRENVSLLAANEAIENIEGDLNEARKMVEREEEAGLSKMGGRGIGTLGNFA